MATLVDLVQADVDWIGDSDIPESERAGMTALNALSLLRETRLETISGKAQAGGATVLSHASTIAQKSIRTIDLVSSRSIFIQSL